MKNIFSQFLEGRGTYPPSNSPSQNTAFGDEYLDPPKTEKNVFHKKSLYLDIRNVYSLKRANFEVPETSVEV